MAFTKAARLRMVGLSLVAVLVAGTATAQTKSSFDTAWGTFQDYYSQELKKAGIVGSSLMLVHDRQVVGRSFYGLAHREQKRPVDENTIYHWASITKTLTGIAIMQLRDRGLLSLDDPIVKYIPELRSVHDPFGDMSEITLRHLMSHSAGFRSSTWPWKDQQWQPHEPQHWSQLAAMFPYTEILFKPGSRYSYSNPGIIFLGRVIELLTTDDYEVYIDKNIFKPLQMYRSYFDATPYHLQQYRAQSYSMSREGALKPALWDVNTGITVSNGGWNAPLTDMVRYLDFLAGNAARKELYDQVLKRSSLEEMFRPQIGVSSSSQERVDMGLIFFLERHHGLHFVAHSGGQNGFISHFYLHTASATAYIVAFNTESDDPQKGTRALDKSIADYLFKNIFPWFARE